MAIRTRNKYDLVSGIKPFTTNHDDEELWPELVKEDYSLSRAMRLYNPLKVLHVMYEVASIHNIWYLPDEKEHYLRYQLIGKAYNGYSHAFHLYSHRVRQAFRGFKQAASLFDLLDQQIDYITDSNLFKIDKYYLQ